MRPIAHFLSLAALTTLLVPVLEVAATAAQKPGFFEEPWLLSTPATVRPAEALPVMEPLRLEAAPSQLVAQVDSRLAEADRLLQQGIEQYQVSQFREALQFWEQALAIYREIEDRAGEGNALGNLGIAYRNLGQYERAIDLYQQRLAIAREIGDRAGESRALGNLGIAYDNLGQYERAIDFHEQALEISREIGDRAGEGNALGSLGNAYFSLGQYERAIDFHEQNLEIAREIGDHTGEGNALGSLGSVYLSLGQYPRAIDFYEQALAIFRELGDRAREGTTLNNLGNVYLSLGQYPRAIDFYEQALAISREIGERTGEGNALGNLGNAYNNLGQYERAINFYQQHLAIAREISDRAGEGLALGNLGNTYLSLGQYQQAINFSQQRLAITQEISDRFGEGTTLGNLGNAYFSLGQYERAIDLYQQHLAIAQEIGDRAGEGLALGNLGTAYFRLGEYERAIDFYQQSFAIAREIGDRAGEGHALGNLGNTYLSLGDDQRALEQYRQAVALFSELGARSEEALSFSNIGKLLNDQEQPELAIVFLKASVDVREAIRGDIRGLETDLQQSFTDTVADDYRLLADLLLQQDRIIEAQRVLDLLKVQELDDYLQDVQRNAQTEMGVDYWQPEADVLALYDDVLVAGAELQRLQARPPAELSPEEQARKAELEAQQAVVYTSFIDWLDHPQILAAVDQLRVSTRSRTVDIENFTDLQASLAQLPQTSVILYPLVLEDRLELVLVSADAPPVRYPIAVDAGELNQAVVALGQALKDRRSDPRPVAQQLYDWVIAPLENDLAAVGAENIIFAPDGVLRYVPLPALFDGEQWLAERFSFSQITAASETDFAARPRDERSLLAAACADCTFTVNVGDDAFSFLDLPGTLREVELLAAQVPGAEVLIDGDFTPAQFKNLLGSHTLIHLATHGLFVSGAPDESFLLFGNGQSVNLQQMRREWSQLDADLVVLSACETALGSPKLGNGIEVLGLGFQLQRVGAKAVVASLWAVSDQGTQVLMNEFYAALNQGLTKAAALQAAQRALITGESATGGAGPDRTGAPPLSRDGALAHDAFPGYSHPYYWAPFILIGNGL